MMTKARTKNLLGLKVRVRAVVEIAVLEGWRAMMMPGNTAVPMQDFVA